MLRNLVFTTALAASLLPSSFVWAQDDPNDDAAERSVTGFEAGLRLGFGAALGDAEKDAPLSELVTGKVPVIVDAGYRISDRLYAGVYFQYALATLADDACPNGADCASSVLRYGVEGQFHLMPRDDFDPWVGLGGGIETVDTSVSAGGADAESSIDGIEFIHVSGGIDYRVHDKVGIGPLVTLTLARYSDAEVKAGNATFGGAIKDKTFHEWLIVGVRARFHP